MPIDTSIYANLLQPPKSVADYNSQAQAYKQNQLNQQLTQADIQNLPLKNQLLNLQVQQQQLAGQRQGQMWQTLQPILQRLSGQAQPAFQGSSPQSMGVGTPTPTGSGAPPQGAGPTMTAPPGAGPGVAGMPLSYSDVLALKLSGGPDLTNEFKLALEGVSRAPGSEVTDVNGGRRTVPVLDKGQQMNPDGSISNIPGFVHSSAESAAAISDAQKGAESNHTLLPLDYRGTNGVPIGGTVGAYISPPAPPPPPPGFPAGTNAADAQRIIAARTASGEINQPFSVNGQPVNLGPTGVMPPGPADQQSTQQKLEAAKAGGPQAMAAFQAEQIPRILSIPDPQNRATAYQNFQRAIASPPGTPMGGATGADGRPQLQGPADAAAQQLQATQDVHAQTDPAIAFQTARLKDAHVANQKVLDDLSDTVRSEAEIQNRNNQITPLLSQYQTGGMAPEERLHLANAIENTGWLPAGVAKTAATAIAGGDPAVGKTIENQLATAGIKTMLDTLDKEGKPNRAIFLALQQAQEGLKSGNTSLQQVFDLQKQLYNFHYGQQQDLSGRMSSTDYNPLTTQAQFSAARNADLQKGAINPPVTAPATTNAQGWVLHRDAKGRQAYVSPDGKQFQTVPN